MTGEPKYNRRIYRLLLLAVMLFMIGLTLVFSAKIGQKRKEWQPVPVQLQAEPERTPPVSKIFNNYPEPASFKHFSYSPNGVGRDNIVNFTGVCNDKYYTVLVFSSSSDYRTDPSSAKFNQAKECPLNKQFSYNLELGKLNGLSEGDYYVIIADQPGKGVWYNPR